MNSKYAKYSTERLEVILTHLADPGEKELVKKELGKRYYDHYLNIINSPECQPPSAASASEADTGEINLAIADQAEEELAEARELADIAAVAPITLSPAAATDLAAKPTDQSTKKKYCFIATAAYGSPWAREVVLLQHYRDKYLCQHPLGEKFILAYYRVSPHFAEFIRDSKVLQKITRCLLTPFIFLIKKLLRHDIRQGSTPGND